MEKKNKLCKMKQDCPQFLAKKDCGFDHVQCKFKDTCKDKNACRFYHVSKPQFDKPKNQTLCRFNSTCTKPNCPFKHQKVEQNQSNNSNSSIPKKIFATDKANTPCRFGQSCLKKQTCPFKHGQGQNKSSPSTNNVQQFNRITQNQQKRQNFNVQSKTQNNFGGFFPNQQKKKQNKYCLNYLLNNNCENGQSCSQSHQFTEKNSIKRLFFSSQISSKNFNILFYEHSRQLQNGGQRQNKELVYITQQNQTLSFRKLISAQNLYEELGGIGPNQQNKTYLRYINAQMFRAQSVINGIQAFTFGRDQYLVFMFGLKICIYNTTKGQTQYFNSQKLGNRLTGCTIIKQKSTLLISTQLQELKRFQFSNQRQFFEQKPLNERLPFSGFKFWRRTETDILGQGIIYAVNNQGNKLMLLNRQLKFALQQFPNGTVVNEAQVCLFNNRIPVCLVSTSAGRHHQIIAINILNLEKQVLFQLEDSCGFNKVFTIQGHLMIQIKNKGLVVYKINQLQKEIGIIPLTNQIQQIRKDDKGNLLILQTSSVQSKGSISIFKIKKI